MTEINEIHEDLEEVRKKLEGIHLTLKLGFVCLIILLSMVLWSIIFIPSY